MLIKYLKTYQRSTLESPLSCNADLIEDVQIPKYNWFNLLDEKCKKNVGPKYIQSAQLRNINRSRQKREMINKILTSKCAR